MENSLYAISYLYWPMIANLLTLFLAWAIGKIISSVTRRKNERSGKETKQQSESERKGADADGDIGACEQCLGDGRHNGNSVDPKLLRYAL